MGSLRISFAKILLAWRGSTGRGSDQKKLPTRRCASPRRNTDSQRSGISRCRDEIAQPEKRRSDTRGLLAGVYFRTVGRHNVQWNRYLRKNTKFMTCTPELALLSVWPHKSTYSRIPIIRKPGNPSNHFIRPKFSGAEQKLLLIRTQVRNSFEVCRFFGALWWSQ